MDISHHLPLTEATFFILVSLAHSDKHGYAIMKEVEVLSTGQCLLSTGTLYGALKRLLELRWIGRVDDLEVDQTGRPRQAYQLTQLGWRVLDAETARLRSLMRAARRLADERNR